MAPIGTEFLGDYGAPSESVVVALGVPPGVADGVGEFINALEYVELKFTAPSVVVSDDIASADAVVVQIPTGIAVADLAQTAAAIRRLDSAAATSPGSSRVTNAITAVPGAELLLFVVSNPGTLPTASGLGLTWVEKATLPFAGGARRTTLFAAKVDIAGSGTVTIDFGGVGQSSLAYSIVEVVVPVGADPVIQVATEEAVGTTVTPTLGAVTGESVVIAGTGTTVPGGTGINEDTGFSQISDNATATSISRLAVQARYANDDAAPTFTRSFGGDAFWGAIAVEVGVIYADLVQVELEDVSVLITVADDTPASEAVAVVVNPLVVVVGDDITVDELVVLDYPNLEATVFDEVSTAEAVEVVVNPIAVLVGDEVPSGEVVVVQIPLGINVVDDNTFPPLEPPPMPATGIARDYVDVEEGLEMGLGLPVLVEDSLTVTPEIAIYLPIPVRAVDTLTVIDVIDTDAVTINPVLVGFDQVVADTVTPLDVVSVVRVLAVEVSDTVAPAEAVAVALPMLSVAADDIPADDVALLESQLRLSVFDDRPMDEEVAALVSVLLASVADESPGEDLVLAGIPMAVAVMDVPEEGVVGERRHISIPKFYEDLHFINDAILEALTSSGSLRSGQVQDTQLGLSSRVRDAGLKTGQGVDEVLEG